MTQGTIWNIWLSYGDLCWYFLRVSTIQKLQIFHCIRHQFMPPLPHMGLIKYRIPIQNPLKTQQTCALNSFINCQIVAKSFISCKACIPQKERRCHKQWLLLISKMSRNFFLRRASRWNLILSLQWRHNGRDGVSNHQPHDCLLNRLFKRRSKKTSKLRVTGLCAGNSPVIGEFPAQMASNAENDSIWWRHHGKSPNPFWWQVPEETFVT